MLSDATQVGIEYEVARLLFVLPVIATFVVTLTIPLRPLYEFLIGEDGPIEWLQVALVLVTAITLVGVSARLFRSGRRLAGLAAAAGVVTMLFIAGEEISWGQRILGWSTPDDLAEINRQAETNIHNIGDLLKMFNVVLMLASLYALVAPITWRWFAGPRERTVTETILIPPLVLAPGFAIAFAYRFVRFVFVPEGRYVISRFQEVTELVFYAAVAVFAWVILRRLRAEDTER